MYYYSTMRLILIYRPSEGGRLSRPRHCSQCAARAQSCVSQWHKLLSAARFEPGISRAAGKRATTRPLRRYSQTVHKRYTCGALMSMKWAFQVAMCWRHVIVNKYRSIYTEKSDTKVVYGQCVFWPVKFHTRRYTAKALLNIGWHGKIFSTHPTMLIPIPTTIRIPACLSVLSLWF